MDERNVDENIRDERPPCCCSKNLSGRMETRGPPITPQRSLWEDMELGFVLFLLILLIVGAVLTCVFWIKEFG
jgi:hypothetical protein